MEIKKHNQSPNRIIFSEFETTLIERRIMYLIVNYLEPSFNVEKGSLQNVDINIPVSLLGDKNYERIKEAALKLKRRELKYVDDDSKEFQFVTPFPIISYKEKEGIMKITVLANVLPIFLELKNGYTQYQIKAALSLTSTYAQKMYEILSRWKDVGVWLNVSIEDLRKMLNVPSNYRYGDFKTKALKIAQKELAKHTDIEFSFEEHKTGRRFTHIDFYVKWDQNKDDYKGIEDAAIDVKSKKCLEYLDKIGIKNQGYRNTIVNEKQDEFWKWIYQVKTQKIKPKSLSGHLLSVLNIK